MNEKFIGEIQEYYLDSDKVTRGLKYIRRKKQRIFLFVTFILIIGAGVAGYFYLDIQSKRNKIIYAALCAAALILFIITDRLLFKFRIYLKRKKIFRKIPVEILNMPVTIRFYKDRAEFISAQGSGGIPYEDFYKIMKLKNAYMFLTGREVFHYFPVSEMKLTYGKAYLEEVLDAQCSNVRRSKKK